MNKKTLNLMFIIVVLVGSISFGVNAAIADIFRAGLTPIENFFSGGWQNYEKTVSFIVFFFLFFSTYLIGMKKAFKELSRAHTVFAFTAAFLSAMIIATTLKFDWINLKYVGWGLIGILVLFLIHSLLVKAGMEKHKFWAFVLALIITALLLGLIWYLMNEGRPLHGVGRFSDWLGTLGEKAAGLKGEKEGEVKTDLWPGGAPAKGGGGGGGGGLGKYWWVILVLLLSALSIWKGKALGKGLKKLVKKKKPEETQEGERPALVIPEEVRQLLESVKAKKADILKKIEGVMQKIGGNEKEIAWIYKKYLQDIKKNGRVPWLRSEGSPEFKAIKQDNKDVKRLIEEQKELEKLLIELSQLEKALLGKIEALRKTDVINTLEYDQLLDRLKNEISGVLYGILGYYRVSAKELGVETTLDQVFNEKHLEDRIKDKWLELVEIKTGDLVKYFEEEKRDLGLLEENIKMENLTIDKIERLLKQKIEIVSPSDERIKQPFILGEPIELKLNIEGVEYGGVEWYIGNQTILQDAHGSPVLDPRLGEGEKVLTIKVIKGTAPIWERSKNIQLKKSEMDLFRELLQGISAPGGKFKPEQIQEITKRVKNA